MKPISHSILTLALLAFVACGLKSPATRSLSNSSDLSDYSHVKFHPTRSHLLLTGQESGRLKLIDLSAQTNSNIWELTQEKTPLTSLTISPDARYIAASWKGGRVHIIDPKDGKILRSLSAQDSQANTIISAIAFSSDHKRLVMSLQGAEIQMWDAEHSTLEKMIPIETGGTNIIGLSADQKFIFSSGMMSIGVWNTASGKLVARYQDPDLGGDIIDDPTGFLNGLILHVNFVSSLRLAALAMFNRISILDTQTGSILARFDAEQSIFTKTLIIEEGKTVLGFDAAQGNAYKWSLFPEQKLISKINIPSWHQRNTNGEREVNFSQGETPIDFSADGTQIAFVDKSQKPYRLVVELMK